MQEGPAGWHRPAGEEQAPREAGQLSSVRGEPPRVPFEEAFRHPEEVFPPLVPQPRARSVPPLPHGVKLQAQEGHALDRPDRFPPVDPQPQHRLLEPHQARVGPPKRVCRGAHQDPVVDVVV